MNNEASNAGKNMKKMLIVLAIVVAVLVPLAIYGAATAAAVNSGSLVLVSQDYIDNELIPNINKANGVQNTEIEALNTKYNSLLQQYNALKAVVESYNGSESNITATTSGFKRVKLEMGQKISPTGENQECIELILERGSMGAVVYSDVETLCVLDVSNGEELPGGAVVPAAHYILIPHANDGRAILAESSDVWVLVRGEYTIE